VTWTGSSLAGLLIGLLVGFTGMGGGSLMTPLLVLVFGFKPSIAIGTDIVHGAIFKSFGAAQHRRMGHVHARLTAWMLLAGAVLAHRCRGLVVAQEAVRGRSEETAKAILGIALVICGSRSREGLQITTVRRTSPSFSRTATA
jgi:uncharacterized membrane protein YfcA